MLDKPTFQLPGAYSTVAAEVDWLYYFVYWVSIVFFVGIVGVMLYFVFKYKRSRGHKPTPTGHHMVLEWSWTLGPLLLLIPMFHWGFKTYVANAVAPADAIDIRVRGKKWAWEFTYPSGATEYGVLKVPANKPVRLVMTSEDVIHSFFIPEFRIKKDVVPGMYSTLWFQATKVGRFQVFCTEYCGTSHSAMLAEVQALPQAEFDSFLKDGVSAPKGMSEEDWGKMLYTQNACVTCHSVDGSKLVGPSFKGVWGRKEEFEDGTSLPSIDENYIRESILKPQARIVKGYNTALMPPYNLQDKQIEALIAFMKTLK